MRIIYMIDEKNRVYPCSDDNGQKLETGQYRGTISGNAYEDHGIPLWKIINDECVLRTAEEVKADVDAIPLPEPTEEEQLRADVDFLTMENEALEENVDQAKADIDYLLMITEEE